MPMPLAQQPQTSLSDWVKDRRNQRWIVLGGIFFVGVIALAVYLDRSERSARAAKMDELIETAQRQYAAGHLEDAVATIDKYSDVPGWYEAPNRLKAESLKEEYGKALGVKREPEVVRLVASAKAARANGDNPRAIGLLTQATASPYYYAPSYTEARELLRELKPPEPTWRAGADTGSSSSGSGGGSGGGSGRLTWEAFDQIQNGWSMAQVRSLLGKPDYESQSEAAGVGNGVVWHYQRNSFGFLNARLVAITVCFFNDAVVTKGWIRIN